MLKKALIVCAASLLSACAYGGGGIENPLVRRASWFSFVDGADIRRDCAAGGPDHYRLVYNASYQEQVRIYELAPDRDLQQRVIDTASLTRVTTDDLLAPWRGRTAQARLTPEAYAGLVLSFAASGMFEPAPEGLELESEKFYWVSAACRGGRFFFNAWAYDTPRYDRLTFDKALQALDGTGVPFNPPRRVAPTVHHLHEAEVRFNIRVGANGVWGLP